VVYEDLQAEVLAQIAGTNRSPRDVLSDLCEHHRGEKGFSARLFAALTSVELTETQADTHIAALLAHHEQLVSATGRKVDLRVSVMDYLLQHPGIVQTPIVVDQPVLKLSQRLAAVDELTGLFNRRFLETYLSKEINRAQRYNQVFSVLFVDVDNFKRINDSYGHTVGDRVLAGLGRRIIGLLRQEDIAARYGGEEFTIVLPQTTDRGAVAFGARLREAVSTLDVVSDLRVSFSGGVAAFPRHGRSVEDIMRRADAALYEAKFSGKDRIVVSEADKRASQRYRTDFPAVAYAGSSEIGPLRLCDISADGCSLVGEESLEPGQVLRVRVFSVFGEERHEYDVFAQVVWSRRVSSRNVYRVGGKWERHDQSAVTEIVRSAVATESAD